MSMARNTFPHALIICMIVAGAVAVMFALGFF